MSDVAVAPSELVTELTASAHLMRLDPGVYCVYHSEGSQLPDAATGLPGARLTLPPGPTGRGVVISGFREDGWISVDSASLIRVTQGPAQVLMTVYQMPGSGLAAPKMQVRRLVEGAVVPDVAVAAPAGNGSGDKGQDQSTVEGGSRGSAPQEPEVAAHIQLRGDVLARIGDWIGDRGSQRWIEGFAVAPSGDVPITDIEYQAVLGRGWLSPWAEGGQYCGSRGMALPILGLRARLRGASASSHVLEVNATFTDGSVIGPVAAGEPCESDSLAPLEAFQLSIRPIGQAGDGEAAPARQGTAAKLVPAKPGLAKPGLAKLGAGMAAPRMQGAKKAGSSHVPPAVAATSSAGRLAAAVKRAPAVRGPAAAKPAGKRGAPGHAPGKGGGR